jgi:hypothetical protein
VLRRAVARPTAAVSVVVVALAISRAAPFP